MPSVQLKIKERKKDAVILAVDVSNLEKPLRFVWDLNGRRVAVTDEPLLTTSASGVYSVEVLDALGGRIQAEGKIAVASAWFE